MSLMGSEASEPTSEPPEGGLPQDLPGAAEAVAGQAERRRGHIALLFVQVFFGLFPFFAKWAFEAFEPRQIVAWRITLGAGVLGLVAFLRFRARGVPPGARGRVNWRGLLPSRADFPRVVACSLLGVVINQVLFVEGMRRTTAVDAGVLMPSIPVFTFLFAVLAGQERFRPARAVGIVIALVGVLLIAGRDLAQVELGAEHLTGNLLILTNCASYALYLVVARPLLTRTPPLLFIAWIYGCALWTVPLLVGGGPIWPDSIGAMDRALWGWAYIIVFPTILSYLLNTFALARVRASTTAVYIYLQPLVACTSGVLWLDETVPPAVLAAGACLFIGIWLVARAPADRTLPAARSNRGG